MRKLEAFWFKYFSYSTLGNEDDWVRYAVVVFLTAVAIAGITCDVLDKRTLAKVLLNSYGILLLLFGIIWIVIYFYHNYRIKHER